MRSVNLMRRTKALYKSLVLAIIPMVMCVPTAEAADIGPTTITYYWTWENASTGGGYIIGFKGTAWACGNLDFDDNYGVMSALAMAAYYNQSTIFASTDGTVVWPGWAGRCSNLNVQP